jgi:hypothetical protein
MCMFLCFFDLISDIKVYHWLEVWLVIECLPSKHETWSSNPSATKKKKFFFLFRITKKAPFFLIAALNSTVTWLYLI